MTGRQRIILLSVVQAQYSRCVLFIYRKNSMILQTFAESSYPHKRLT